ncbi:MAG: adenine deaminase C-terminal domain-containing protein [Desulfatiglandales bacterium]|jgi:adenine deaminase|nr:adenine deaminase C-terminal domain-containing protein [Desulfatiglandales bacterium]
MFKINLKLLQGLVSVSKGETGADVFFANGQVVNVYTGEILEMNVATYKNRIAYVGPSDKMVAEETLVLDVEGAYLVPGFIDAHCHADIYSNPATFADWILRTGTTTVLADAQDLATSLGVAGFKQVIQGSLSYPVRMFFLVPVTTPLFPEIEGDEMYDTVALSELLREEYVRGFGEVTPFPRLIRGDSTLLSRIAMARNLGKSVEGHTVGASYDKLNSLVASGLTSCHESILPQDVLNRLRLGLYTMVRCGSIRCELQNLAPILQDKRVTESQRIILTPDGLFADDIMEKGYMDYVISEAIKFGVDSIHAIRMGTVNPALYLGMDQDLGAIAPGRLADILVVENLERSTPRMVMQDGRVVVNQGKPLIPPSPPPKVRDEGKPFLIKKAQPEMFLVIAPKDKGQAIPVISIENKTVTRRRDMQLPIVNGFIQADPKMDILKVAVVSRNGKQWNCGFVTGLGAGFDGFASSVGHEVHEILVIGGDDNAMMQAMERVLEIKGGVVLVKAGKVIHELRLPIGGIISERPLDELAKELIAIKEVMVSFGSPLKDPLFTICFLTFSSMVDLRITVSGIYDVKKGEIIFDSKEPFSRKS